MHSGGGWRLSPAFDINPNPDLAEERSTSIGGATSRSDELDGLMLSARDFGLSDTAARTILGQVFAATRQWREVATSNGIPASDLKRFEAAFEGLRTDVERLTLN